MPLGWIAGAMIVGDVVQGIGASKASGLAHTQDYEQRTIFGEQQQFEQQLAALIADPSSVSKLPGYQFQMQQGTDAVARRMAASGFLGSGNEAVALTQYGQGLAQNFYTTQANLLASLSGITSASSPSQLGANANTAQSNASSQWTNVISELFKGIGGMGFGGNLGTSTGVPISGDYAAGMSGGLMPAGGGYTYNAPGYMPGP